MDLNDAKNKINNYLQSTSSWPLIVDIQTKQDLSEIIDFFKIGDNQFPHIEKFCNQDGLLKIDEVYAAISNNTGNTFYSCITGFLKLLGEDQTKSILKTIVSKSISGHAIIFTYQCKNYLKFSDPRIYESGRVLIVDGSPDNVAEIYFISPALSDAFPTSYQGVEKIGYVMENCTYASAYITTAIDKKNVSESVYHISRLDNGYDILRDIDHRTTIVPQSFGNSSQWNYALKLMGSNGNWSTVIEEQFGSENNLSHAITDYSMFDENKQWLYFIALSICGVKDNEYLQLAVNSASNANEFVFSVFCTILDVDKESPKFDELYKQRKNLLNSFRGSFSEVIDYCKSLSVKEEDAIYYLTDLSQPEKEYVIAWLDKYGKHYNSKDLVAILKNIYPDLSKYLSNFHYNNELLDSYFENYKYQKVINHILPSFEIVVNDQSSKRDFVTALKPRTSVIDRLDVKGSRAFFVDALGVEYLSFIQEKCNEYDLSINISCARCELPSITKFNKDFVETFTSKGCKVSDIKDLDEIKHHGEDSFDYEKEKTPIYLVKELEIIDNLLKKIKANLLGEHYEKAIIISDHGASRLAVLHNTENKWSMATSGEHSGRCCRINEVDSQPDCSIKESGFWVLANYDRFKGGRKANVEVHGGASLEEVAVPIIEITLKKSNVEAFIVDKSKIITLGPYEHAVIRIFASIKTDNISIKINNKYYNASKSIEPYVYIVDLPDYTKKGKYFFDIVNGSDIIATDQLFEIKKKGISEVNLFE